MTKCKKRKDDGEGNKNVSREANDRRMTRKGRMTPRWPLLVDNCLALAISATAVASTSLNTLCCDAYTQRARVQ